MYIALHCIACIVLPYMIMFTLLSFYAPEILEKCEKKSATELHCARLACLGFELGLARGLRGPEPGIAL